MAEVAPSDIGNSEHVIAILRRGTDPKEVLFIMNHFLLCCAKTYLFLGLTASRLLDLKNLSSLNVEMKRRSFSGLTK